MADRRERRKLGRRVEVPRVGVLGQVALAAADWEGDDELVVEETVAKLATPKAPRHLAESFA